MEQRNYKIIIAVNAILLVVLLAGLYFFVHQILKEGKRVAMLSAEVKQSSQRELQATQVKTMLDRFDGDIGKIKDYTITTDDEVSFIENIQALGRELGLETEISQVDNRPYDKNNRPDVSYLVIKLSTKGSWKNTWNFISLVENFPYAMSIDTVGLVYTPVDGSPKSVSSWQSLLTIRVLKKNT